MILQLIADGSITTTAVALLLPHLTPENHATLLADARHKTKREVEHQIACLAPRPDAPPIVRRISATPSMATPRTPPAQEPILLSPKVGSVLVPGLSIAAAITPRPRSMVESLSSDRYLLRVTLTANGHANLRRAQNLMRHAVPGGDPVTVVEKGLELLVDQLERQKIANVVRPRRSRSKTTSSSRHIPASVRREVWARDEGRCAFVGARGRCGETGRLEFHHLTAFARGGPSHESDQLFGEWHRGTALDTLVRYA